LKANKVNLFVSSVFFVFWYHSPNVLYIPHICNISWLRVKERVELYLYFPSGPSWPVIGWPLPFPLPYDLDWENKFYFRLWLCKANWEVEVKLHTCIKSTLHADKIVINGLIFVFGSPFDACFGALYGFVGGSEVTINRQPLHSGQYSRASVSTDSVSAVYRGPEKKWKIKEINGS
jgi:hypothetical protein